MIAHCSIAFVCRGDGEIVSSVPAGSSSGGRIIRLSVLALTAFSQFAAPAALAAPSCWDRNGDPIRCGAPGAMPVGWSLPPEELRRRDLSHPASAQIGGLLKAVCVVGVFLCVIALLPEFDGTRNEDWEE